MKFRERKIARTFIDAPGVDYEVIIRDAIQNHIAKRYPKGVIVDINTDNMDSVYVDGKKRTKGVLSVLIDTYKDIHDDTIEWDYEPIEW